MPVLPAQSGDEGLVLALCRQAGQRNRIAGMVYNTAVRLWTIQTIPAWETLQAAGVLRAESRLAEPDFAAAYRWMVAQMRQRLPRPSFAAKTPLWAWYQYRGPDRPRPDLRKRSHLPAGQRGVRIEFELADELVLLSDFELWHLVLNNWYLGESEADADAFDKLADQEGYPLPPDSPLNQVVRDSWTRIFDLDWSDPYFVHDVQRRAIQATFWELPLQAVRKADFFTAR